MDDFEHFDPGLFGIWTERVCYGEPPDPVLAEEARLVLLEVKSAENAVSAGEELRRLLNEMTVEMRDQFLTFRKLRAAAELALDGGDDAAQKLARADVKAATDAISLIVRTLEKVDSLQRQLARDRDMEAERATDQGGYEEAKARFIQMIEDRANENALRLFEIWKRDGPPDWVSSELQQRGAEPADDEARSGDDFGQGGGELEEARRVGAAVNRGA